MTLPEDPVARHLKALHNLPRDPALALLFPGQGSQKAGMGLEVYQSSEAARAVFEAADAAMGTRLSRLCFEGPETELTRTINAQPAILTTSVAYLAVALEERVFASRPAFMAGHSLGEYSALVAAGSLAFADAVRLVRARGSLMEEAGAETPGTMAAIVGLTENIVSEICRQSGAEPCNYNARTQIVLGGPPDAVAGACALAKERGGRGLPMNVAGAFHTSLMAPAAGRFERVLKAETFADPIVTVIGNVTAEPIREAGECRSELAHQIRSPVRWHQSVVHMLDEGVRKFVELGPGKALTTMLKRDEPELEFISLDAPAFAASHSNV